MYDKKEVLKILPIEFAVAIPKNSTKKELANEFVKLLISPDGERMLEGCGLIPC